MLDAFSRLRISNNNILNSSVHTHDLLPFLWDTSTSNSGTATHLTNQSSVRLQVTSTSGSQVIRQTKRHWLYRAAQSQVVFMTFGNMVGQTATRKRVGIFDASDGIFLETTATDVALVLRSKTTGSVVDARVPQAQWNVDQMKGLGPSGVTLDLNQVQLLTIDYQWLGAGRVRVGFNINGHLYIVHQFLTSNITGNVYMGMPNLPVRYELETTASGGSGATLQQICAAVVREGGEQDEGTLSSVQLDIGSPYTSTTTPTTVLSVRLKDDYVRGGFLKPLQAQLIDLQTAYVQWYLVLNPTLGGALTWADVSTSSAAQVSTTNQSHTAGTGHIIAASVASGATDSLSIVDVESYLGVMGNIAGTSDVLSIVARANTGTQNVWASMQFLELH